MRFPCWNTSSVLYLCAGGCFCRGWVLVGWRSCLSHTYSLLTSFGLGAPVLSPVAARLFLPFIVLLLHSFVWTARLNPASCTSASRPTHLWIHSSVPSPEPPPSILSPEPISTFLQTCAPVLVSSSESRNQPQTKFLDIDTTSLSLSSLCTSYVM